MKIKSTKKLTLSDLEFSDGAYNVGHLVTLAHPWVSRDAAEEILEIHNALLEAVTEQINETQSE